MKSLLFFLGLFFVSISLNAQVVVRNQTILYELELTDTILKNQLDSILFVEHPCLEQSEKRKKELTYFMNVKEEKRGSYTIGIMYAKSSSIETDVNTGIFKMNGNLFVVTEESETPLFKSLKNKITFVYEKNLMPTGDNSYYYKEIISPGEFCVWILSYSDHQLKVERLEQVKNAKKEKKRDPFPPPMDEKLEVPVLRNLW